MVSVSISQAGLPGLNLAKNPFVSERWNPSVLLSTCHAKAAICLVYQGLCHVLSCLCGTVCKILLGICRKSRSSCPISSLLSIPICHVLTRSLIWFKQAKHTYKHTKQTRWNMQSKTEVKLIILRPPKMQRLHEVDNTL